MPRDTPRTRCTIGDAEAAWSEALGAPAVLLGSVATARHAILDAAGVGKGDRVVLPVNATDSAVRAVVGFGARPVFRGLDGLAPEALPGAKLIWRQPVAGLPTPPDSGQREVIDHGDSVPAMASLEPGEERLAVFGLHLPGEHAGAVVACGGDEGGTLAERLRLARASDDPIDPSASLAQLDRLAGPDTLAGRQLAAVAELRRGLQEAAGLPLLDGVAVGLPQGVAVRVPDGCDGGTFYAYVERENTPIRWLPLLRPAHFLAMRHADGMAMAEELARWLLVPAGPASGTDELAPSVLGIVKAAEYLGLRWITQPERAAAYARLLDRMYGPDRDGFRPLSVLCALRDTPLDTQSGGL